MLSYLHNVSKKHKETDLCGRCGDLSPVKALAKGSERLLYSSRRGVFSWDEGTAHWTARSLSHRLDDHHLWPLNFVL